MFSCGYARVVLRNSYIEFSNGAKANLSNRKSYFEEHFKSVIENFSLDGKKFDSYGKALIAKFRVWRRRSSSDLDKYLDHFSSENWKNLLPNNQALHTLARCDECQSSHKRQQKLFDEGTSQSKGKTKLIDLIKTKKVPTFRYNSWSPNRLWYEEGF